MHVLDDYPLRSLDWPLFPRTHRVVQSGLSESVAPAISVGYWSGSDPDQFFGLASGDANLDSVYDLASLTKVLATAILTAVLVERKWIRWNSPIGAFLPDYPHGDLTVAQLLSHTAGLPAWKPFYQQLNADWGSPLWKCPIETRQKAMRRLVFTENLECRPGEKVIYSDLSFLLLGFLLEEALQMPLDVAVRKIVWEPMKLHELCFIRVDRDVSSAKNRSVVPTEDCPWRGGVLQGQVHDDNCWAMGGVGGHAGVFGTLREVLAFSRALFDRFLTYPTLMKMWSPWRGFDRTLGWDTPTGETPSVGSFFSKQTVGHLGYTGTSLWVDLEKALAVCVLTNRVRLGRDNLKIKTFRPQLHDALVQDLGIQND